MIPPSQVVIYTDGACSPNPGVGGWAGILLFGPVSREISGGETDTTNNRMEIMAVLNSLKELKRSCEVTIYSDSQYVVKSVGSWVDGKPHQTNPGWMVGWREKGWVKTGGPVKNIDLWELIYTEAQKHKRVNFEWVKGHADNYYNNRCDLLAVKAREKIINDLLQSDGLQCDGATDDPDSDGSIENGDNQSV